MLYFLRSAALFLALFLALFHALFHTNFCIVVRSALTLFHALFPMVSSSIPRSIFYSRQLYSTLYSLRSAALFHTLFSMIDSSIPCSISCSIFYSQQLY